MDDTGQVMTGTIAVDEPELTIPQADAAELAVLATLVGGMFGLAFGFAWGTVHAERFWKRHVDHYRESYQRAMDGWQASLDREKQRAFGGTTPAEIENRWQTVLFIYRAMLTWRAANSKTRTDD